LSLKTLHKRKEKGNFKGEVTKEERMSLELQGYNGEDIELKVTR
jgi:hypothetical protein